MNRVCPYCESVEIADEEQGGLFRCRACGRSSLASTKADVATRGGEALGKQGSFASGDGGFDDRKVDVPTRSLRRRDRRGAPGEMPGWPAAVLAMIATGLFYGLLSMLPTTGFSVLFTERGWVPYVITLISVWALFLLGARLFQLRRERAVLGHDWIQVGVDGRLGPEDAAVALEALRAKPARIADSFLARRLERALRHFQSRRRAVETVEFLASESRADEGRVDASYGLVRVFVWAVPTLGFIGTVIGIGAAVAGFSDTLEAASSLEGMKESIGLVTGGLGVAFDTTLLALVMSILIMFPASAVQRIEETFLGEVDDYCAENLIPKLRDESTAAADDAAIAALASRLIESMRANERREG